MRAVAGLAGSDRQGADIFVLFDVTCPDPTVVGSITVQPTPNRLAVQKSLHPSFRCFSTPLIKLGAVYAVKSHRQIVYLDSIDIANEGNLSMDPFPGKTRRDKCKQAGDESCGDFVRVGQ